MALFRGMFGVFQERAIAGYPYFGTDPRVRK